MLIGEHMKNLSKLFALAISALCLSGCGGVLVDQKVFESISNVCKDNGGLYEVYVDEAMDFVMHKYKASCKDGTKFVVKVSEIK